MIKFRAWGLSSRVKGYRLRAEGLGVLQVKGFGFRAWGSGFRDQGSRLKIWGSGHKV